MKNSEKVTNPSILNNLAIFYARIGRKELSYNHFKKAISIIEEREADSSRLGSYYHNIAKLCEEKHNYKEAIFYYLKKVNTFKKLASEDSKYTEDLITSYDNLAKLYLEDKNYAKALKSYHHEKKLLLKSLDKHNALKLSEINQIIMAISEIDHKYYLENIKILSPYNSLECQNALAHNYMMLGNYYTSIKNYSLAKKYYLENIKIREHLAQDNIYTDNFLVVSYLHLLTICYHESDYQNVKITKEKLNKIIYGV